MLNNISLISKKFHNITPFLDFLNFKLCRRGDLYTITSKDLFSWFVMILWFVSGDIFCFLYLIYRLLKGFIQKKYRR